MLLSSPPLPLLFFPLSNTPLLTDKTTKRSQNAVSVGVAAALFIWTNKFIIQAHKAFNYKYLALIIIMSHLQWCDLEMKWRLRRRWWMLHVRHWKLKRSIHKTNKKWAYLNGCNMQHATSNYLKHLFFFFGFLIQVSLSMYILHRYTKTKKSHANQAKIIKWNGWCSACFLADASKRAVERVKKNELFQVKWKGKYDS